MMRSVEYLYPIILILILQMITTSATRQKAVENYLHEPIYNGGRLTVLHTLLALFFITFLTNTLDIRAESRSNYLADYSIIEDLPAGSRVLNVQWSPFPILFYLNHQVQYARGIDPHLDDSTELYDKTLDKWATKKKIQELGFAGAKNEFVQRISKAGFHIVREAQNLDVAEWVDDIQRTYTPDYVVLTRNTYPILIEKLLTIQDVTLVAESKAIAIFTF